jgi:hypothetical protein
MGTLPDGRPIYKKTIVRAGPHEPKLDPDGQPMYGKNPITGDRIYEKYTRKAMTITLYVVPNNQGNGNLTWDQYFFPTQAELQARARREKIELTKDQLAEALVDGDLNISDLITMVRTGRMAAPTIPAAATEEPAVVDGGPTDEVPEGEFPKAQGGGVWLLSDGNKVRGKAAAIDAQQKLAAAAGAALDAIPES